MINENKDVSHDVIDGNGNFVVSASSEELAKIIASHYSYHEKQMTVRPS
jgi:hypothetical protein